MNKNRIKTIAIVVTPLKGKSVTKTLTLGTLESKQRRVFEVMGGLILDLQKTGRGW